MPFSDSAGGFHITPRRLFALVTTIGALLLAGSCLVVYLFLFSEPTKNWDPEISAAQRLVIMRLGNPRRVEFSSSAETQVSRLGENTYRVAGAVQVISPNGRSIVYNYKCTMLLDPDGGWVGKQIDLSQRY